MPDLLPIDRVRWSIYLPITTFWGKSQYLNCIKYWIYDKKYSYCIHIVCLIPFQNAVVFHSKCKSCRIKNQNCREHTAELCVTSERLYDLPSSDKICTDVTRYSCFPKPGKSAALIGRRADRKCIIYS